MDMKYVILEIDGDLAAFIFPNSIAHKEMARRIVNDGVPSAGFFYIHPKGEDFDIEAYGLSESIGVRSRPVEDAKLIKRLLTKGY